MTELAEHPQHGVKGVYYAGDWVDIEDCDKAFNIDDKQCSGCDFQAPCPRSRSRYISCKNDGSYDVLIIGAGCVGAAIARELSRYKVHTCWVEAADDVSQGATKGNSGIVHAGYDDKPGTNRAKYCWPGNQMFTQLDKELRFGYQKNGSLVVAFNEKDREHLQELLKRGETNGVKNLRILEKDELFQMEPHVNPKAIAALYSPDAGNVIPYEFAIALAENAVDNGIELRIRRHVTAIEQTEKGFTVKVQHWEPEEYLKSKTKAKIPEMITNWLQIASCFVLLHFAGGLAEVWSLPAGGKFHIAMVVQWLGFSLLIKFIGNKKVSRSTPLKSLVDKAGMPQSNGTKGKVKVEDMLVGGSGSQRVMSGEVVNTESIRCKYIINCAGGYSDKISRMIGDDSFEIKPRLGDYILLNRSQGKLVKRTLFPCPDPKLGKGVLVQTTLWGNLILGPTARDMHEKEAQNMSPASIQEYILSKCKLLVGDFDPTETIHAFAGARAKSSRGDWIIEHSEKNPNMIHVAGIDSPGLAGSPAIALDVIKMLKSAGVQMDPNPIFKPNRAPIIFPKQGSKGLKFGPPGKNDSDGSNKDQMAKNVICKCEKVTELEVVTAMRRSLPIDSSQGIRKRTRAGMGHCQGDPENYCCEARVRAIIARENGVKISEVGGRPWPATSTLSERWIGEDEKKKLLQRMK